jgi:hypothetical protein
MIETEVNMNIANGLNLSSLFRPVTGATQAQVTAQAATGGGVETARDSVQRTNDRRRSLNLVGAQVRTNKLMLKETKVAAAKKR